MEEKQNRKLIYIWNENLEFYDSIKNKSDLINRYLKELKDGGKPKTALEKDLEALNARQRDSRKD